MNYLTVRVINARRLRCTIASAVFEFSLEPVRPGNIVFRRADLPIGLDRRTLTPTESLFLDVPATKREGAGEGWTKRGLRCRVGVDVAGRMILGPWSKPAHIDVIPE
jgi:hypothetical protein